MVQVQQRLLETACWRARLRNLIPVLQPLTEPRPRGSGPAKTFLRSLPGLLVFVVVHADISPAAQRFLKDDPLKEEPVPLSVTSIHRRDISDAYDLFSHTLATPGEKQPEKGPRVEAQDINTLGEVIDGAWYRNRLSTHAMTVEELKRGPGIDRAPAEGTWTVVSAKNEGVTPGFLIEDEKKRRYFIKFDPLSNPEMATAADVLSSKFFHAFGYYVPENYIVKLDRSRLKIGEKTNVTDASGVKRRMTDRDINDILLKTPRNPDGTHRASASLLVEGQPLGPYRYYGTRHEDPNDVVPHEHHRSLRGLHVFCAWLDHDDSRAINSLDTLVDVNGIKSVRHYLIDFGSTLGSASYGPNSPRSGFEQFFAWGHASRQFLTFGLYVPNWMRIEYPNYPSIGRFSAEYFDPPTWTPEYPNPSFNNRLPEDIFWAARQVGKLSDADIRAVVSTGELSDKAAEEYLVSVLIARRNAVMKSYLSAPLSIDEMRVESGKIVFHDWASPGTGYQYQWNTFDNASGQLSPINGQTTAMIPAAPAPYLALMISDGNSAQARNVTIYLRQRNGESEIVGITRKLE